MSTDAQKKSIVSTDAHRHKSKLWQRDAEMLSVVPGEGLPGATLIAQGARYLFNSSLHSKHWTLFSHFYLFL